MTGRSRFFALLGAFSVFTLLAIPSARAADTVDQSQTTGAHFAFGALTSSGTKSVCQSFVPTTPEITRIDFTLGTYGTYASTRDVEIFLTTGNCKGGSGSQTVLSHQLTPAEYDALSGGTSQPLTKHVLNWDFPTIEIVSGQTYYLGIRQLDACSGCLATLTDTANPYASGSFRAGTWNDFYNESPATDLWFVTYDSGLSLGPVSQFAADGTTTVPESASIGGNLVIKATPMSADGSAAALEVEFLPFGTPFVGTPTHVSSLVPSGSEASVTIPLPADSLYHYRVRAGNGTGDGSPWREFGAAGNFDVEAASTPLPGVIDQSQTAGTPYGFGTATNGGGIRTVCQSFVPASSEITGIDLMIGTFGTYDSLHDVQLFLSSGDCQGASGSQTLASHPLTQIEYDALSGGTTLPLPMRSYRWDTGTVPVTPGQTYYLGIRQTDACQNCLATFVATGNPYAPGTYRTGTWTDSFSGVTGSDLWFRTHGNEPGPTPIKVAVILADLADVTHADPATLHQPCKLLPQERTYASYRDYYTDMFFCINDYYDENSYGTVTFDFSIINPTENWYPLSGTTSTYGNASIQGANLLSQEGVGQVSPLASGYQIAVVVHAGDSSDLTKDASLIKTISFTFLSNLQRITFAESDPMGAWAHELGHVVGYLTPNGMSAPDLYTLGAPNKDKWDLMAYGSFNGGPDDVSGRKGNGTDPSEMSSFTRSFLGWMGEDAYSKSSYPSDVSITSLPDAALGDRLVRYNLDDSTSTDPTIAKKYYILEGRTKDASTWSTSLPSSHTDNLVLYYVNTKGNTKYGYHISGEEVLADISKWNISIPGIVQDGFVDPAVGQTFWDYAHSVKFTAHDPSLPGEKRGFKVDINSITASEYLRIMLGGFMEPDNRIKDAAVRGVEASGITYYDAQGNPHEAYLASDQKEAAVPITYYRGVRLISLLLSLVFLVTALLLMKFGSRSMGVATRKRRVRALRTVLIILLCASAVSVVYASIRVAGEKEFYRIRGLQEPPSTYLFGRHYNLLSGAEGATPDLDLHVRCPDGRHVGMNYQTGQYENQIANDIVSGDNQGAPEWILFPPIPENAGCIHSVSARDNQAFLDANPEVAAVLGSATDSYEIYARYIDPATGIFTSSTLSEQVISPNEVIVHAATGTSDIQILPGVPDTAPPVTMASVSGTAGLDGWFTSDVTVSLSASDAESGVQETRYSLDDGATYVPYPGQIVLTVDGVRTVTYFSIDGAGNAEAPKTLEVKIDRLAPETGAVTGPVSPTYDTSATFSFSSPEADALFECALDAGAFAPCASPATYAALAYGAHAFSVRAVDPAGNADPSPSTYAWTVNPAATASVTFLRHTVQSGTQPGSTKASVVGAAVKAFSKIAGSCASAIGFNPHDYGLILDTCASDGTGTTDTSGLASVGLATGDYLLLSRDPQTAVVSGVSSGNLALGGTVDKFLQVIVRANGTSVPGKTTTHVGSLLHVIEPEYVEWNQTQELYPFVFDAPAGEWGVTVTVSPPEGFVADYPELSTDVNNDYRALQFTLTDVGSCWECGTGVDIEIRHQGRTIRQHHVVQTPMTEDFMRRKGLKAEELEARGVRIKKAK